MRTVVAVVVGYVVMFVAVFVSFSIAYLLMGTGGAFRPGTYDVSLLWVAASLVLGFLAAVVAIQLAVTGPISAAARWRTASLGATRLAIQMSPAPFISLATSTARRRFSASTGPWRTANTPDLGRGSGRAAIASRSTMPTAGPNRATSRSRRSDACAVTDLRGQLYREYGYRLFLSRKLRAGAGTDRSLVSR